MDIVNNIKNGTKVVGPGGREFVVRYYRRYPDESDTFRLHSPRWDVTLDHRYTAMELKRYDYKIV